MDRPTGEAKSRGPLFIGLGVGAALLLGVGLYLERPREVGKLEKIQVDESDFGKLKARTFREIGSFEASLSGMQEDTARLIRPLLKSARDATNAASSVEELERARGHLEQVRELATGKGN